jgi:hypothetical protein
MRVGLDQCERLGHDHGDGEKVPIRSGVRRQIEKTGGIPHDVFWRELEAESRPQASTGKQGRRRTKACAGARDSGGKQVVASSARAK